MNSNKIVADSLTECLREFQAAIAPLLELGKVEQWDGRTLLKREKKIREAALILGGKCIAILLKKLSDCHEVQLRAINQTIMLVAKKNGKKWLKNLDNFNNW